MSINGAAEFLICHSYKWGCILSFIFQSPNFDNNISIFLQYSRFFNKYPYCNRITIWMKVGRDFFNNRRFKCHLHITTVKYSMSTIRNISIFNYLNLQCLVVTLFLSFKQEKLCVSFSTQCIWVLHLMLTTKNHYFPTSLVSFGFPIQALYVLCKLRNESLYVMSINFTIPSATLNLIFSLKQMVTIVVTMNRINFLANN